MVAFVSGNGLGLFNSSLGLLGGQGSTGSAGLGRSNEQVYINTANGNLVVQRQDEVLVGQGPDIGLVRTYNSQGLMNDDNGDNWRLSVHKRLHGLTGTVNTAGSTIKRTDTDGAELTYTWDAGRAVYINKDGSGSVDTLSYNSSTAQWSWTDGDTRVVETYDWISNGGKLLKLTDANGKTLTYGYTGNLLTLVTDASGEQTHLVYSGNNLTEIRTAKSDNTTLTRTRYTYDTENRLSKVTLDLTPEDNSISDGKVYVTTYTYDGTSKRIASITQTDGTQIGFVYTMQSDNSMRVTQINQLVSGATRTTNVSYDLINRKTTVTDPLGNATVHTYDTAGRLTNLTGPAISGGTNQSFSYAYGPDGKLSSQTDAKGNAIAYEYDGNGNLRLQRDAAGNTITRAYGSKNELLAETIYLGVDPDGAGAGQPTQPKTTRYSYDAKNNLRFTVSAEGRVTEYRYEFGPLNGLPDQLVKSSTIVYAGNLYSVDGLAANVSISESSLVTWVADTSVDKSKTMRTDMEYGFRGQVSSVTRYVAVDTAGVGVQDGAQSTTHYIYDHTGQLLQTISPRGVATTTVASDFITSYTYDGLGRLLSTTDTLGNITLNHYDDTGRTTKVTLANGLATTSTYNQNNELIGIVQADGATTLGQTVYKYDANGQLRRVIDAANISYDSLYDEAGRKVADIDGNGSLVEYIYNNNNQIIRTIQYANAVLSASRASLVDASGNPTAVTLSEIRPSTSPNDRSAWNLYDSANRLVKAIDELGFVTETKYEGASRITDVIRYAKAINASLITAATQPADAAVTPLIDSANDRRTRSLYDSDGKLVATLDAGGYLSENQYDAAGRLVHTIQYATKTDSAYWLTGTLTQLRPAADVAQDIHTWNVYDSQGRVIGNVDAEGHLTETVYDVDGNKTQQTRYANRVQIIPTDISNTTQMVDLRPASHAEDRRTSWTYTDLNQVETQANAEGTITQFTYDNVGNLIKTDKNIGDVSGLRTQQAKYDKLGRVIAELTPEGSAALAALGSPTQAQIDAVWKDSGISHVYDPLGRKISSTDQNGYKTLFYYNAESQLLYTINALGEVIHNIYNNLNQLTQTVRYGTRLDGATLASFTPGVVNTTLTNAITALANDAIDSKTKAEYDLRGQVINSIDELNNVNSVTYNAFGETVSAINQINSTTTFRNEYEINRQGLRTKATEDAGGLNRITEAVYDAFGRVTQRVDGNNKTTIVEYDRLGRVVHTIDALNSNRSTTYDAFDRVLTVTDGNGNITTTSYDKATRTTTLTSPEGIQVSSISNRHGETVQVIDGNGNSTSYSYDRNGNLKSTTNDALGTSERKNYDNASRLIETIDANGIKISYAYDAADRVLSRTVDPTGLNLTTSYVYDAKGQKVTVTGANNVVTQTTYDLKGQAATVTVDPTGLHLQTTYAYDARGKILTVTEGAGSASQRVTQYTYDKLGRRTQEQIDPAGVNLTTHYAYDQNDNLVAKTDAGNNTTRYFYNAGNQLVYVVNALGQVTESQYDAVGKIVKTVEHGRTVLLNAASTLTDVASGLNLPPVDAATINQTEQLWRAPTQPYAYTASATQDVATAATQTVSTSTTSSTVAVAPNQPYTYIASAKSDVATTQTQNVGMQVTNTSVTQSGHVMNYSWYRSGDTLATTSGVSIAAGYVSYGDSTPTEVRAHIYKDGAYYNTVYTDVGYTAAEYGWIHNGEMGYMYVPGSSGDTQYRWNGVNNWYGQVNLSSGAMPSGVYTVVVETRDDARYYPSGQSAGEFYDAQDETWAYSTTLSNVVIGTVINPTVVSWAASTQPAGTTASFSYRVAGSTGGFTGAAISANGANQQVSLAGLAAGNYEYQIKYTDSYGCVLKSASGTMTSSTGTTTAPTASFSYTQVTSTAVAGSSISGYIAVSEPGLLDPGAGMTISNGTAVKTGGVDSSWDAGFRSRQGYTGGAFVSFVAGQTNRPLMVGLNSDPNTDNSYTSMDWAMYVHSDGQLYVYENGNGIQGLGSYAVGDKLSVTYDGTAVHYAKNGVSLRSVAATISQPLYADSSFYSIGAKVTDIAFGQTPYINNGGITIAGGTAIKTGGTDYAWDAGFRSQQGFTGGAYVSFVAGQNDRHLMVGLNSDPNTDNSYTSMDWAMYLTPGGELYVYENGNYAQWLGSYAVGDKLSVTYDGTAVHYANNGVRLRSVAATISQPLYADSSFYRIGDKVTNIAFGQTPYVNNGGIWIADGTATKVGGADYAWDAGFRSRQGFTGGAYVSFAAGQTDGYLMVGLNSDPNTDNSYASMDWAMYVYPGGQLHVYESGNYAQALGSYAVGDKLSVTYDGTAVHYAKNGVILRSVAATITQPLYADSSFYRIGNKVTDIAFGQPAFVNNGGIWIADGTATKVGGTDYAWNAGLQSRQGYTGGAHVSAVVSQTNKAVIVGLNTDPATDNNYVSVDWALTAAEDGRLRVYESGNYAQELGSYAVGDKLSVTYDGTAVHYAKNGVILRSVAATITQPLFADIPFYHTGAKVTNIEFGASPSVRDIARMVATVRDRTTNAVVSTATTYPEYEANYAGNVNLKTGSVLATGKYIVDVVIHYKNGTSVTKPSFNYDVGDQSFVRNAFSWAASTQPENTTASFKYRVAGSAGAYTAATVSTNGANQEVLLDGLAAGNYEYQINYTDSYGRVLKSASGILTYSNTVGSTQASTDFSYTNVTSTAVAGSAVTDYISTTEAPTIDKVRAVVKDLAGNTISTAWTYPELQSNYTGQVNLKTDGPLAEGKYTVAISVFYKNGTVSDKAAFAYELGQQDNGTKRTTTVEWSAAGQPANTVAQFSYALVNSTSYATAPVTLYNGNNQVALINLADGNYQYHVRYADIATGRVIKEATGHFTAAASGTASAPLSFEAGLELVVEDRSHIFIRDADGQTVFDIDSLWRVTQNIYDGNGNVVQKIVYATPINSTAKLTLAGIEDAVTAIANPSADRTVRTIYDAANRAVFSIDALGYTKRNGYDQSGNIVRTVAYANPIPLGGPLTAAAVTAALEPDAAQDRVTRVVYDNAGREVYVIDAGGYVNEKEYDAAGRIRKTVRHALPVTVSGTPSMTEIASALSSVATTQASASAADLIQPYAYTTFATQDVVNGTDVTSTPVSGSAITGYIASAEVVDIDRVVAKVTDPATNQVVSTATTYPGYVANYAGHVNLKTGSPLSSGRYKVEITVHYKNGTSVSKPSFDYDVAELIQPYGYTASATQDVATPATQTVSTSTTATTEIGVTAQPYAYIASAKSDVATTQTQNVAMQVTNTSLTQSGHVMNYSWYRSGDTLATTSGVSIAAGYVSYGDTTPTEVRAHIYKDGAYYNTVYTDVGYTVTETDWNYVQDPYVNESYYWERTGSPGSTGYHWYGVNNWNGQINLSSGAMPAGTYTIVVETRDDAQYSYSDQSSFYDLQDNPWDEVPDTWAYSTTLSNVVIGSIINPTVVSWAASTQPAGTTASFSYRVAGSTGGFTGAAISANGANQQVSLAGLAAGNYEYQINYTDSYGRVLKSAAGTMTSSTGTTTAPTASFSYTQVTSTAVAGSSISGYIPLNQVAGIEYVDAVVMDLAGNVVSTARTYPEFEASYTGNVNLKTGSVLANGKYTVSITVRHKNGTVENKTAFAYEVGDQSYIRNAFSWAASAQPANTTASFKYRVAGSTGAYTAASVLTNGSNQQVLLDGLAAGNYEYQINYTDSYNRILKSADGTLTYSNTAGSTQASTDFSYTNVTSTAVAGSAITGYISTAETLAIDHIVAKVIDLATNQVISTAETYPEHVENYAGQVNLKTGSPLINGRYKVEIAIHYKDGTAVNKPPFDYDVAVKNIDDQVTLKSYDAAGRLSYEVDAQNYVVENQYDARGRVAATISYNAPANFYGGSVDTATIRNWAFSAQNPAVDRVTRYVYDEADRKIFTVDAEGYVTQNYFDGLGNVTKQVRFNQPVAVSNQDISSALRAGSLGLDETASKTAITHYEYNALGDITKEIDAENYVTITAYDDLGQVRLITVGAGRADATTTAYAYDLLGRMARETKAHGTSVAATTEYQYNAFGDAIQVVEARGIELAEKDTAWAQAERSRLGFANEATALNDAERQFLKQAYSISTTYDVLGRKTEVKDPLGNKTKTDYNAFGNATKVTSPLGHSGYFYFDKLDRNIAQIDPEGYLTLMQFNAGDKATEVIRFANKVQLHTGAALDQSPKPPAVVANVGQVGQEPAYVLADPSRDAKTVMRYDRLDRLTSAIDAENNKETYQYADLATKTTINKLGGKIITSYDRRGLVSQDQQIILYQNNVTHDVLTKYEYDARGNRIKQIDNAGADQVQQRVTEYQYDLLDRKIRIIGQATKTFDSKNLVWLENVRPTETIEYDARGNVIRKVDSNGNTTWAWYDAADRADTELTGTGTLIQRGHDAAGNVVSTKVYGDPVNLTGLSVSTRPAPVSASNFRETQAIYDANGRVNRTVVLGVDVLASTNKDINPVSGLQANLLTSSGNLLIGLAIDYEYNAEGQVWRETRGTILDASGNEIAGIGTKAVQYSYYDRVGNKIIEIDPEEFVVSWIYDGAGNVTKETKYVDRLNIGALALRTGTGTNSVDVPLSINRNVQDILAVMNGDAGANRIVNYGRDRMGRVISEVHANVEYADIDASTGQLTDASGQALSQTAADGGRIAVDTIAGKGDIVTNYAYDAAGNVREKQAAGAQKNSRLITTYAYDSAGRIRLATLPEFTDYAGQTKVAERTANQYDNFGQVVLTVNLGANDNVETDDERIQTVFDLAGRQISMTNAKGETVNYGYDANGNNTIQWYGRANADGNVSIEVTTTQFDQANRSISRQTSILAAGASITAPIPPASSDIREVTTYNTYGDVTFKSSIKEGEQHFEYDRAGRVSRTNAEQGITKMYLYDGLGKAVLQMQSQQKDLNLFASVQSAFNDSAVLKTTTFYDRRGQMVAISQPTMQGVLTLYTASSIQDAAVRNLLVADAGTTVQTYGGSGSFLKPVPYVGPTYWPSTRGADSNVTVSSTIARSSRSSWNWKDRVFHSTRYWTEAWTYADRTDLQYYGLSQYYGSNNFALRTTVQITNSLDSWTNSGNWDMRGYYAQGLTLGPGVSRDDWRSQNNYYYHQAANSYFAYNVQGEIYHRGTGTVVETFALGNSGFDAFPTVRENGYTYVHTNLTGHVLGVATTVSSFQDKIVIPKSSFPQSPYPEDDKITIFRRRTDSSDTRWDLHSTQWRSNDVREFWTIDAPQENGKYEFLIIGQKSNGEVTGAYNKKMTVYSGGTDAMGYPTPRGYTGEYNEVVTKLDPIIDSAGTLHLFGLQANGRTPVQWEARVKDGGTGAFRTLVAKQGVNAGDTKLHGLSGLAQGSIVWIDLYDADGRLLEGGSLTGAVSKNSSGVIQSIDLHQARQFKLSGLPKSAQEVIIESKPMQGAGGIQTVVSVKLALDGSGVRWVNAEELGLIDTNTGLYRNITAKITDQDGNLLWTWDAAVYGGSDTWSANNAFHNQRVQNYRYLSIKPYDAAKPGEGGDKSLSQATSLRIGYRLVGAANYTTTLITTKGVSTGAFVWNATELKSGALYDIYYEGLDSQGQPLARRAADGSVMYAPDGAILTKAQLGFRVDAPNNDALSPGYVFEQRQMVVNPNSDPRLAGAKTLRLGYAKAGEYVRDPVTGREEPNYTYVDVALDTQVNLFRWNMTALTSGALYHVRYQGMDASGQLLKDSQGITIAPTETTFRVDGDNSANGTAAVFLTAVHERNIDITRMQIHNAFGEVAQEIDGNAAYAYRQAPESAKADILKNWVTDLEYNTMGQLIRKREAAVSVVAENGSVTERRPETRYYYGADGSMVGIADANLNLNTQLVNGGVGTQAVEKEWRADGGKKVFGYDVFGNRRFAKDDNAGESPRQIDYTYDANNRLSSIAHATRVDGTRAVETFAYDILGQRIKRTNALGFEDKTYFDGAGRVTRSVIGAVAAGGTSPAAEYVKPLVTDYSYARISVAANYAYINIGTGNMNTVQAGSQTVNGWRNTVTDGAGRTIVDDTDSFGRTWRHTDQNGRVFNYQYNHAGLIATQTGTSGQNIQYAYYDNGYLRTMNDLGVGIRADYQYDHNGNRTFEGYTRTNSIDILAQSNIKYDRLNRISQVVDGNQYSVLYQYDLAGNRRNVLANFLDPLSAKRSEQTFWYSYDRMNRFTITMGSLQEGSGIILGTHGVGITYDKAGNRIEAKYGNGTREVYTYENDGYLKWTTAYNEQGAQTYTTNRLTDLAGRVTSYTEMTAAGRTLRNVTRYFSTSNQIIKETDTGDSLTNVDDSTTTNTYDNAGVLLTNVREDRNAQGKVQRTSTQYEYDYWDSAKQRRQEVKLWIEGENYNDPTKPRFIRNPGMTDITYDVNGHIAKAIDWGNRDGTNRRDFTYITDADGQIMSRTEYINGLDTPESTKLSWHKYFYVAGRTIGNMGNNGAEVVDYGAELRQREAQLDAALKAANQAGRGASGSENDSRFKRFTPTSSVDFDNNYQPINSSYPGGAPGHYTTRDGDTLRNVAAALWGDSALWYLLAEANGLTNGTTPLVAGVNLMVPNVVTNFHNNSTTFRPYDAGRAIGDTSPTLPTVDIQMPPPGPAPGGGCGIKQILVMIIAIVATIFTAGAAGIMLAGGSLAGAGGFMGIMSAGMGVMTGAGVLVGGVVSTSMGMVAAAIGGAVGSIVSQGAAMAMGIQDKFSWKQVGLSAVASGVTAGMGGNAGVVSATGYVAPVTTATANTAVSTAVAQTFSQAAEKVVTSGLKAAVANTITQGVAVATGLQKEFSWRGVAASAVGAGVSAGMNLAIGDVGKEFAARVARDTITGFAGGMAGARVSGGQANAGQIAMQSFGSALGNQLVQEAISYSDVKQAVAKKQTEMFGSALGGNSVPGMGRNSLHNKVLKTVEINSEDGRVFGNLNSLETQSGKTVFDDGSNPYPNSEGDSAGAMDAIRRYASKTRTYIGEASGATEEYVAAKGETLKNDFDTLFNKIKGYFTADPNRAPNLYSDYDLGSEKGMRQFLDDTSWQIRTKVDVPADQLSTAKTILESYYGLDGSMKKSMAAWDNLSGAAASDKFETSIVKHNMWSKLNTEYGTSIDFSALTQFEGGQQLKGYVPMKDGEVLGRSGVTIATGFDIGQMKPNGIEDLDLHTSLEKKLLPYAFPKVKNEAVTYLAGNPLAVTRTEAGEIDYAVKGLHLSAAIDSWNKSKPASSPSFEQLTPAQQTVIFSRTFHQGIGMPNTNVAQNFYNAAQTGRWREAESSLRNYDVKPQWYKNRVAAEANLLVRERTRNAH